MSATMTLNVRVGGRLRDHVAAKTGAGGTYENVSEYVRDLIRRDRAGEEAESFERLKAELQAGFGQPESSYVELTAEDIVGDARRSFAA